MSAEEIFDVLSHGIRRRIIELLGERGKLSYSEILEALNVDTGSLNYHLGKMKKFYVKNEDGTYSLSSLGVTAYSILKYAEDSLNKPVIYGARERKFGFFRDLAFSFAYVVLRPQKVFNEVREKALHYAIVSSAITLAFAAFSIAYLPPALVLVAYFAPLLYAVAAAKLVYKVNLKATWMLLIGYGISLLPRAVFYALKLFFSLSSSSMTFEQYIVLRFLLNTIAQPLLLVAFAGYLTLAIKDCFKLDWSRSFVVAIVSLILSRYTFNAVGLGEALVTVSM